VSDSFEQRRRFPRIASENVVLVRGAGEDEHEGLAKTKALGLGGLSFVTEESLGVGRLIELFISLGGRVVPTRSRVVYEVPVGDRIEVGVEFVDLDPEAREYLRGYFPDSV
jgi:hypothetical protein